MQGGKYRCSLLACSIVLLFCSASLAQLKEPSISPIVRADGSVALALNAAQADSVKVVGSLPGAPALMEKRADGIWRIELKSVEPGFYFYSFEVDGVQMIDPSNRYIHLSMRPNTSTLVVPGERPLFYEERAVQHGTVRIHRHRSKVLADQRGYLVYTPPHYDHLSIERYPVLYLLHGYTDTEMSWYATGRANLILDNLLAERAAAEMIIVMPFGYPPVQEGDGKGSWGEWFGRVTPRFERYIVDELVGRIDKEYRTVSIAQGRAIAGLSMGGGQALYIGLKHSDTFSWVGGFSSAVSASLHFPLLQETLNEDLALLWVGCGREDFLYKNNSDFIAQLGSRGIRHVAHIGDGGHEWPVWHRYLREFAGLLFKK
jgi:enterochelin esterase-like enzyme